MKKGIHPEYKEVKVVMSDGSEIVTRSTMKTKEGVYKAEIDSKNHPFYIGSQKMMTAAGRVDQFKRRYGARAEKK
jgi:large subunit ribosomal protein L31